MGDNYLRLPIHFVWATWDRLPIIQDSWERRLHRTITAIAEECRCQVLAVGGMPDHVHLLVTLPSTITVGDLMKQIKGGSSRFVSKTLTPSEWFAWQGSYGALVVCDRERIIRYIANQKQHHADSTLWPNAEKYRKMRIRRTMGIRPDSSYVRAGGHAAVKPSLSREFIRRTVRQG